MKQTLFLLICLLIAVVPALAAPGQGQTPLALNVTGTAVCNADGTSTVTLTFVATSGNVSGGFLSWTFGAHNGTISINPGTVDDGGDWMLAVSGPVKTFTTTVTLAGITSGTYTADGEVHQQGGNYDDVSDTESVFVQACLAENKCDKFSELFGEVKNNKNLAKNGSPLNFKFKGSFGDAVTLTIFKADGVTPVTGPMSVRRDGESCVYTYQWIPMVNGAYVPAGNYLVKIEGNDASTTALFELSFSKK